MQKTGKAYRYFLDNGAIYSSSQTPEYAYDANGNLTRDDNKKNVNITYNYLNLPASIDNIGGDRIEYIYDAAGNKRQQVYLTNGIPSKTTDFVGNFVYENFVPAYVLNTEGRVILNSIGTAYCKEVYLEDHLGNVRVTLRRESGVLKVRQVDSYYPFGMNIKGLSVTTSVGIRPNEYLYNGKMMQDEMGLGWLDYGARFYDPVLGRWHVVDPLAEKAFDLTLYRYAMNNPIKIFDKDGLDDFFDINGNLIKSTPQGNQIHLINSSIEVFNSMLNIASQRVNNNESNWNQANQYLSVYTTSFNDISVNKNNQALRGIIWNYYVNQGYDPSRISNFGLVEQSDCDCTAQSYGPPETYEFAYKSDKILPYVQNSNDIQSLWNHETYHRQNQVGSANDNAAQGRANHLNAYWNEISNTAFKGVSSAFRKSTISNIGQYLKSIDKKDLDYWKPRFEEELGGKFELNKDKQYEFINNEN